MTQTPFTKDDKNRPRALRRSPLHHILVGQGAQFGESARWMYPLWFQRESEKQGKQSPELTDRSGASRFEHLATRESVGVYDVSLLSKFIVDGPGACDLLNWLSTNEIDVPVGKVVYTPWCDDDGRIFADVTVTRLTPTQFLIIGTDTVQQDLHDALDEGAATQNLVVTVSDVTSGTAVISVQGPNSRRLLQRLSDNDLTNECFRYMSAQQIEVAGVSLLALRITFTGDLGWELHVPAEYAVHVYTELFRIESDFEVTPCGIDAMYSLGAEKGFLDFGYNLDGTLNPLESMLEFTIAWKKPTAFRGQQVLEEQLARPTNGEDSSRASSSLPRLVLISIEPLGTEPLGTEHIVRPGEPVLRNNQEVGEVVAIECGHSVGTYVGYALLRVPNTAVRPIDMTDGWMTNGSWSVSGLSAQVGTTPWFDPTKARIRS